MVHAILEEIEGSRRGRSRQITNGIFHAHLGACKPDTSFWSSDAHIGLRGGAGGDKD